MEKNENIWILTKLREECEKVHLDSEAKALAAAVYSMGIVEEMKQQRDAALEMVGTKENHESRLRTLR